MLSEVLIKKIVVTGDCGVGKSAIILQFLEIGVPSVEGTFFIVDAEIINLEVQESDGREEFAAEHYGTADAFLLVCSLTSRRSFDLVAQFRQTIIDQCHDPNVPILLVGNKHDMEEERTVSTKEIAALAAQLKVSYIETTALGPPTNIDEALDQIVRMIRYHRVEVAEWVNTCTEEEYREILESFPECRQNFYTIESSIEYGAESWLSPIHIALSNDHLPIVDLLLRQGARVDLANIYGQHPMHIAATNGHLEALQGLRQRGASRDVTDKFGRRPLHLGVARDHPSVVRHLLDQGADIDDADEIGQRALHYAAERNYLDLMRLLLERGADTRARDRDQNTPFLCAYKMEYLDACVLMIKFGAKDHYDVNFPGDDEGAPVTQNRADCRMVLDLAIQRDIAIETWEAKAAGIDDEEVEEDAEAVKCTLCEGPPEYALQCGHVYCDACSSSLLLDLLECTRCGVAVKKRFIMRF